MRLNSSVFSVEAKCPLQVAEAAIEGAAPAPLKFKEVGAYNIMEPLRFRSFVEEIDYASIENFIEHPRSEPSKNSRQNE